jgi:hypothetical protein
MDKELELYSTLDINKSLVQPLELDFKISVNESFV